MNGRYLSALAGAIILFGSASSLGQQVDLKQAAAAKEAAGSQARAAAGDIRVIPSNIGNFVSFDAPGAGTGSFQGTTATAVNPAGAITGYYVDATSISHGFLRTPDGAIATFDAPGAAQGTTPVAINPAGNVTGNYCDANGACHGFLRSADGTIASFDPSGSAFSNPVAINPAGTITGSYFDANFTLHAFLRSPSGVLSSFDVPGAGQGTIATSINAVATISGSYADAVFNRGHGFLLTKQGGLTTFDAPAGGFIPLFAPFCFGTCNYISNNGVIAGTYFQTISGNPFDGNYRAFVRDRDGTFTTFDAATYSPCCIWSFPSGITSAGAITGSFNDGFTINHGFLRTPGGVISIFDAPGAGTQRDQGTVPLGITESAIIIGFYVDANGARHGFLLLPSRQTAAAVSGAGQ